MQVVNRFTITPFASYILIRFGFNAAGANENDIGENPIEIVFPITTLATLAVRAFETVLHSTVDLTDFFAKLQTTIGALNNLSTAAEEAKAKIVADATAAPKKAE